MNAIVIALVPRHEGLPLTEQAGAVPGLEVWQWRIDRDNRNAGSGDTPSRRQTIPPFWTWFIENPRSRDA
jgi:hypothetical protein